MFVTLRGGPYLLWRPVDKHRAELDVLVEKRRDTMRSIAASRLGKRRSRQRRVRMRELNSTESLPPNSRPASRILASATKHWGETAASGLSSLKRVLHG
jgi:hypothetical protein